MVVFQKISYPCDSLRYSENQLSLRYSALFGQLCLNCRIQHSRQNMLCSRISRLPVQLFGSNAEMLEDHLLSLGIPETAVSLAAFVKFLEERICLAKFAEVFDCC